MKITPDIFVKNCISKLIFSLFSLLMLKWFFISWLYNLPFGSLIVTDIIALVSWFWDLDKNLNVYRLSFYIISLIIFFSIISLSAYSLARSDNLNKIKRVFFISNIIFIIILFSFIYVSFFHSLSVDVSDTVSIKSQQLQIGLWDCTEYSPDVINIGKMVFVKNEIAYIATDYNHDNFIMYENKKIGVEYDISNIDIAKTSNGNRLFFVGEWKGFPRVFFYGDYFGNPTDRKKYFSEKIAIRLYTETDPPYFSRLYFDGKQIETEYRDITSKPIFSYDESKMALSVEDYNGIEKVVLCNL